jgi:phenylpropionate dioxygenase-like ring-hydroxylating dioxygenase large terminal subunit
MDREALEYDLVRRLLDHVANRTTDLADDVLEVSTDIYSAERQAEEFEVLFRQHPLVFCLSGALPKPGSYLTLELAGVPLLLTRDSQGKAHAFVNACRHRGVRVADGLGEARRFTCPFHAWTYSLDGALMSVALKDVFGDVCNEERGLIELPTSEGYGVIVGRLREDGGPVDVDDYLGPELAGELSMFDFADWQPHGEPHVHKVEANWKVTLDTFRENYHFNFLHKTTLATYAHGGALTFDPLGRHLRNCSALRSIDELREIDESEWVDPARHISVQYALFPNVSLTFDARHIELWQIVPIDESHSEVVHTAYLKSDLSDEERAKVVDMAPWICEKVVDGEDFWVAGRTEPNVRTGHVKSVLFGRNEPAPQHLHRGFDAALNEARSTN